METSQLITIIVIGTLVGVLAMAISHAQIVWLGRRKSTTGLPPRKYSRLVTWTIWACALSALILSFYALTSVDLPEQEGFLIAESLFVVRPRPGLVAKFENGETNVHKNDSLIVFNGPHGEDGHIALKKKLVQLKNELESERKRPLDIDSDTLRQAEIAKGVVMELEQRARQIASEHDAIKRDMTQRRLALADRFYSIEQDIRSVEGLLAPLRKSRTTEKEALRSQEKLVEFGYITRLEFSRKRDAFAELETKIAQFENKRGIFELEKQEIIKLRSLSETTFAQQLDARSAQLAQLSSEIDKAKMALIDTEKMIELERPHAIAMRERQLKHIKTQIEDCESLLRENTDSQMRLRAPFDGKVGFREPLPATIPADNGPLLVMYQSGQIRAMIHLESAEAKHLDFSAKISLPSTNKHVELQKPKNTLLGSIVQKPAISEKKGAQEILIACDPPPHVVRQLAMGGTIPVWIQLNRTITSMVSFWASIGFALVGISLVVRESLRRYFSPSPSCKPDSKQPDHDLASTTPTRSMVEAVAKVERPSSAVNGKTNTVRSRPDGCFP